MIQQIIPASARFSEDIRNMIESHILERNKYWSKLPIVEEKVKHTKVPLEAPASGQEQKTSSTFYTQESGIPKKTVHHNTAYGSPDLEKQLKEKAPIQMGVRLSKKENWTKDNENINTLAWIRADRDEPAVSTGNSSIDDERKKIFDTTIKTRQRINRTPARLFAHALRPIHGGVNNLKNKKPDLFRTLINSITGSEKRGLEITTGSVQENVIVTEFKELFYPEDKKRKFLTTSRIKSTRPDADTGERDYFGNSYSKWTVPFTIISSSVETGYNYKISTHFSGGVDFANLHQDIYGPHYEVPMQGPFTEKWVGGFPYRHVWSQFSGSAKVGSSLDTRTNRVEGWRLVFKEDSKGKYAALVSPISSSVQNPRSMIWEGPKRPVNVANIRMTTGSGGYRDPKHTTKIGNYRFDYNIISTTGRKINNRYFVKNQGIDFTWHDYQKPDSWALPILGVSNFTTIDRSVSGSNDFVFVNRFNAPGGPETMCESFLDLESGEYSVYNCLNYRNLSVRLPLKEYLTNHSNKFGFWSDTQYSASWQTAIDSGFKPAGSYAGTATNETSGHYRGTSTSNQPMSSYHNVNRNSRRRIELEGASSTNTVTGTVHDNYWIQHPIPRTGIQYSWISASLITGYSGSALYGYEKSRSNEGGRFYPKASTTLTFISASEYGSYLRESVGLRYFGTTKETLDAAAGLSGFVFTDFAGLNLNVVDPITASTNTIGHASGIGLNSYSNTGFITSVNPETDARPGTHAMLNAILLNRNGPYQHPSWKQMRQANHPIARNERKNSILSFMYHEELNRFTESLATPRYKPLVHVFKDGVIKHTYANNLANFANVEVRDQLNIVMPKGDQPYDHIKDLYLKDILSLKPELISFYYREMLYPREINVYLKKARLRENYVVGFWRGTRSDRTKNSETNSQGQTILKQSIWPLDARETFATVAARGKASSAGNDGAGELLNNYTTYHGQAGPSSDAHPKIIPAALYSRPVSASVADGDLLYGDTLWESGDPFYDSYAAYSDEIKRAGQTFSINSEFRISEHMEYYLDEKNGDFFADREGFLTCTGSSYADSTVDNFFKTYSHTDFLKYFSAMYEDHDGILDPAKVTFTCNGIMKLLPYKGFYPADRTLQLATLFSQSYNSTEFTTSSYGDNAKRRISLTPFFAPGILYNSIKSGIAVDYPIYTKQPGSTAAKGAIDRDVVYTVGTGGSAANSDVYRLSASFDYRLPFDSLVRPEDYIGNGRYIYEAEPDPTARVSGSATTNVATSSIKLDLVKSDTYKLAMHNFLATSIDLFLKNGEVSTLVSSQMKDIYIVDRTQSSYKMRFYLSDHQDISTTNSRNFSMYNRQTSFGPTVNAPGNVGGYAPFTPPYYHNDTQTGYSYIEYAFTPWKHTVADKYGTEGTDEYTLDEIISNSTITAFRSVGNSQLSGAASGNNYVQDIDMMSLTASINIFQKDAHLIAQPRFESPIFNFTNVTKTSPSSGDASTKGIWHQKGVYETDNSKGIFFGALDVEGNASLADLITVEKGLKKIGTLPDDGEKIIREAIVAVPVIKKYNNRTKKVETKFININKNMVKRAVSSVLSDQPSQNVSPSVFNMVKSMLRYVIPPKFDFLTQLKKFGTKRYRPFAMYFFEFEHEFSQEDIANIWQNLPPVISSSFKKEQVTICHSLERGELLTIKELKNPDLHWMVFKVKQKAKWNYFDKVIDLAGNLPPRPDAGIAPISVQLGREAEAPLTTHQLAPDGGSLIPPGGLKGFDFIRTGTRDNLEDIVQYARQESDVASGYGLDYSYNWPYDFCSLVELIKLDTEIHLGGNDAIQVYPPIVDSDGESLGSDKRTIVTTGLGGEILGAKEATSDDTREELLSQVNMTGPQATAKPTGVKLALIDGRDQQGEGNEDAGNQKSGGTKKLELLD